jgi:type IV secretion system protein TrbB
MQTEHERLVRKLRSELGQDVLIALDSPTVTDIFLNEDGRLWQDEIGASPICIGEMAPVNSLALLGTVATIFRTVITHENSVVEGELPLNGERFAGTIFPTTRTPTFAIRKHAVKIHSLADYVADGLLNEEARVYLERAITARKNILIIGGTNAGKTTFANAILDGIARIVIIEDTRELQCSSTQVVSHRTSEQFDMQRLLRLTLRYAPNRIIVGELRGAEALTLIKAWNTGHPGGCTTLHANSVESGLLRLEQLVSEATTAQMSAAIAEAVHVIVSLQRDEKTGKRCVTDLLEVKGYSAGSYVTEPVCTI